MKKALACGIIGGFFLGIGLLSMLVGSRVGHLAKEHDKANVMALSLLDVAQIDQDIVDLYITYGTMPVEKREVVSKLLDKKILKLKTLQLYMEEK